jgi:hypothetical protein
MIHGRILGSLALVGLLCAPSVASARRNAAPAKPAPAAPSKPAATTPAPAKSPAAAPTTTATPPTTGAPSGAAPPATGADPPSADEEVTRYTFTGLDIDGELRTPALLQFLARIGGEFETVGIPHRSFMPELSFTVSEDAL